MNNGNINILSILFIVILTGCSTASEVRLKKNSEPLKIIFETDMGNDVDDALALDMLYKYIYMNKIDLLGVMLNKEGEYPVHLIDIMNKWYGHKIPIGVVRNGADSENDATNYAKCVVLLEGSNGEPLFKRSNIEYSNIPDAHKLYRKILSKQPINILWLTLLKPIISNNTL